MHAIARRASVRPVPLTERGDLDSPEEGSEVKGALWLVLGGFPMLCSCSSALSRELYQRSLLGPSPVLPGRVVEVTWMGTAGVLLTDHETSLLVDPFVSRYGLVKVALGGLLRPRLEDVEAWIRRLGLKDVAAVLVSHAHYDHALDAPFFAERTGALLVGDESTANIGRGAGLPEERLQIVSPGDALRFGRFRITFLESSHGPALFGRVPFPGRIPRPLRPPAKASQYRQGTVFSILVEHPAGALLHHASAGYLPGVLERVRADTVLLGLAGRERSAEYLRQVVDAVGATRVIPIHFDDFFEPLDRPMSFLPFVKFPEFVETARRTRPTLRIGTLPIGQPIVLLGPGG
jgi:L-ascorbate metabolism protein UlaG (beta-lactamase superfamily)